MPSESQKDEICIVSSNAASSTTPTSSDMLSAAFQKQATVADSSNYNITNNNNTMTTISPTSSSSSSNSKSSTVSPTTPTHRTTAHRKQQSHDPTRLRPSQLATMLKDDHYAAVTTTTSPTTAFTRRNSSSHAVDQPLMIDVRDYEQYEKQHIRNSINVNLPTLLIKRYRRGTVSNFNLESFIATEEGKQYYLYWIRKFTSSSSITTTATATATPHTYRRIIVYDDTMQDMDSPAWILVNVMKSKLTQQQFKIYTLDGGFNAFVKWDAWAAYLTGFVYNTTSLAPASSTSSSPWSAPWDTPSHIGESGGNGNNIGVGGGTSTIKANSNLSVMTATPTQSRSATTFSSGSSAWMNPIDTNVQRRASLFSLDTSTAREKFHNRQQRFRHNKDPHVKPSRSRGLMKSNGSSTATNTSTTIPSTTPHQQNNNTNHHNHNNEYQHHALQQQEFSNILESPNTTQDQKQQQPQRDMDQVKEEEEEDIMMTAPTDTALWSDGGGTPSSEGNHAFIISEIVPGFLYLGPEISTEEQLFNLQSRSIKQILNMAEECNDDVPGLKDQIKYHKVAAQDTVIMQNVEKTLKRAVQVIDQAKDKHEPIYVHCKAGKSRSVAAILAYFVLSEKWTLKRAYQHVIKTRPSMSPNIGFVAELLKLEKSVHGQVSNFGAPNWQSVDPSIPPSPESQKAIGKVELAWSSTTTTTSGRV
ncbi:hypothetical protein BDA99DRAFT_600854 [Phascolomyces articulosus]|uniref:protein-tyrosine-phosphatase n=1 Tax=Phascolomyces articulosus TaxID=60185 RepID=A0AAD5PJP4_9FUNG|nr:hypothetical protein BDA99DRAFT_600854 [Phascolomyces articulosus]